MPSTSPPDLQAWQAAIIAGSVANSTEQLVFHPLDTLKTRFQLIVRRAQLRQEPRPSLVGLTKTIVQQEGVWGGLYRGVGPALGKQPVRGGIKFGSNQFYRDRLGLGAAAAGTASGVTECLFLTPFEFLKVRLMAGDRTGQTFAHVVRGALADGGGGPRAFWSGLEVTCWRNGLWNGAYFGVLGAINAARNAEEGGPQKKSKLESFLHGATAGSVGSMFSNPFDVVKSRVQNAQEEALAVARARSSAPALGSAATTDPRPQGPPPRTAALRLPWAMPVLVDILRAEGPRALYAGFIPKILRLGPGGGCLLLAFDSVKDLLPQPSSSSEST